MFTPNVEYNKIEKNMNVFLYFIIFCILTWICVKLPKIEKLQKKWKKKWPVFALYSFFVVKHTTSFFFSSY